MRPSVKEVRVVHESRTVAGDRCAARAQGDADAQGAPRGVGGRTALRRRAGLCALLAILLALRATPSAAHAVGISRGEYRATGNEVSSDLLFARGELLLALPELDADRDGTLSGAEIEAGRGPLATWATRGVAVRAADEPCSAELVSAAETELDGVEIKLRHRCARALTSFALRLELLPSLSLGHRHLASASAAGRNARAVLYEAQPGFDFDAVATAAAPSALVGAPAGDDTAASAPRGAGIAASAGAVDAAGARRASPDAQRSAVRSPFRLGFVNLLTGYGQVLFLLVLVLAGTARRFLLRALAAFTIAHSITLPLAGLGIWLPRPALVEAAIALSIVYVGVQNGFGRDASGRWRSAFVFGLAHGVAFGAALRGDGLAATPLPTALASFNVGIEAGQLAVLALLLPLVTWLGTRSWFARGGLRAASVATAAVAVCWLVAGRGAS